MLLTLLFIFFLYILLTSDTYADEVMLDYDIEERRHTERLEAIDRQTEQIKELMEKREVKNKKRVATRRRFVRQGDITLGEEIMEEYDE
jgi:flagellar motility protein MotE (MotC chaperone)